MGSEQHPAVYDPTRAMISPSVVHDVVETILSGLTPTGGRLWILFQEGSYEGGRVVVPEPDASLVRVLEDLGYRLIPATLEEATGVFIATR